MIDTRARVFIFNDSSSLPEEWAAAFITGHCKVREILDGNTGPFFVSIYKHAESHVAKIRLPRGYIEVSDSEETIKGDSSAQISGPEIASPLDIHEPAMREARNPKAGDLFS